MESESRSGWAPKNVSWNQPVFHELSHALDFHVGLVRNESTGERYELSTATFNIISKEFNFGAGDISKEVSIYGSTGAKDGQFREFYAEALSEAMCSSSPRKIANRVKELTDEYIKDQDAFVKKYDKYLR